MAPNDDQSASNNPSSNQQQNPSVYGQGSSGAAGNPTSTAAPSTTANPNQVSTPGVRQQNPLGYLADYTYQLSLYMVTSAAYNLWVQSGRNDITQVKNQPNSNNGVYLIAQSGGINDKTTNRAPGFQYDYYIDNLRFHTLMTAKAAGGDNFNINFEFDIIEPYGFSFIKNIAYASDQLYGQPDSSVQGSNSDKPSTALRGIFILGIKFLGYNKDGSIANGSEVYNGVTLDNQGNNNGIFNTYYDLKINTLKFKLSGKPSVYNIVAVSLPPGEAISSKRGSLDSTITVNGATVEDALNDVVNTFNKTEQSYVSADGVAELANEYSIIYKGPDADKIRTAKLVTPADVNKATWSATPSTITNPSQVNPVTSITTQPDPNQRTLSFGSGQNLSSIIGQIIGQSTYITDALANIPKSTSESDPTTGAESDLPIASPSTISWYNLSSHVEVKGWDKKRGDWVYKIILIITTYDTPAIQAPSVGTNTPPYPGAYKLYNYIFTGKNSEILDLHFEFDNLYYYGFITNDPNNPYSANNGGNVPIAPGKKNNVNQQGKIGPTMEAINSYRTFLEDPGAYVNVRMKIIGDPDFLMNPNLNAYAPYNKYYNFNSFTVNPNSSQVFVEVNIRESTDYNDSTGLLDLNSNISFGPLPNGIKFNGIPLWILDVNNTFRQGVFEQELTLNGAQWQLATKDNTNSSQNRNTNNNNTNSPTKTQPSLVESYFGIKNGALSTSNLTPTVPSTNDDQNPISVQSQNNTQSILFTNQGRGP